MKTWLINISFLICSTGILGQDSVGLHHQFDFEFSSLHIINGRDDAVYNSTTDFDYVTDNPFGHTCVYGAFHYMPSYHNKYFIYFSLYSEERSYSGGNNYYGNIKTFPRLTLIGTDTFNLLGERFKFYGIYGDLWDIDIDDKLRFYNIDFNGIHLKLGRNKWWLEYTNISDLSQNIGLGLTELEKFTITYKSKKWSISNSLETNYRCLEQDKVLSTNHYMKYSFTSNRAFYFQLGLRVNDDVSMNKSFALCLGQEDIRPGLTIKTNLRYYSSFYNVDYKNQETISYRGSEDSPYVGKQLYPLKNYYRELNQWAFFTDRQLTDILNMEFYMNYMPMLHKKLRGEIEMDLNVNIENWEFRVYPIYNVGISVLPIRDLKVKVSLTNKHMNLDNFYHTFYISKVPRIAFEIRKTMS
ncbi:MAG: hypothetical protein HKN68_16780 [Saprospiraceae bacterium]|nr:hypothetical protein [Saprospiraceae bacterium]